MNYVKYCLKIFILILGSFFIYDLLMFGMSVFTHKLYIISISFFTLVILQIIKLFFSTKIKFIHYNDISISYKKRIINYKDIDSLVLHKSVFNNSILIKKSQKLKSLHFSYLPVQKYIELKNLFFSKVDPIKIKIKKMRFLYFVNPLVMVLFVLSFILNTNVPSFEFIGNSSIQPSVKTEHYSFQISAIEYKTEISNNSYFVINNKGKIFYREFENEGESLRLYFKKRNPENSPNDLSQIDYWFFNDFGVLNRFSRLMRIKSNNPITLNSAEFKGVLLRYRDGSSSLRLKKKDSKGFLKIDFNFELTIEQVLEILESVSYD